MNTLIDGKGLAEAIGVSPSAISMAAREERPCEGWPVHDWVRRGPSGSARGYAVPPGVREELGLPPTERAAGAHGGSPASGAEDPAGSAAESEAGSGSEVFEEIAEEILAEEGLPEEGLGDNGLGDEALDALTRRYLTVLAARVAQRAYEEMGPWLKAAIRARLEAGEGLPAATDPMEPAAGPEEDRAGDKTEEGEEDKTPERYYKTEERPSWQENEWKDGPSVNIQDALAMTKFMAGVDEGATEDGDTTEDEDGTEGTGRSEGGSGPAGDSRSEGGSGRGGPRRRR